MVSAIHRARHPATRPCWTAAHSAGQAVGELDAVGEEPPRTVAGAAQHRRELRHTELIDRRRPRTRERLRRGEARLRELRVREVQVGPVHRQPHQLDVLGRRPVPRGPHRTQQLGRGVRQRRCGGLGHDLFQQGPPTTRRPKSALQKGMWKESPNRSRRRPREQVRGAPRDRRGGARGSADPRVRRVDFYSAYAHGFARVAAITVPVTIADPAANAERVIEEARRAHEEHVAVAVFPELGLSGYSVEDLFLQDTLLDGVRRAIDAIVSASVDLLPVIVVGAPLARGSRVYNCAVVIHRGEVIGVAPKSYLPNYREFYERRWFAPGDDTRGEYIEINDDEVPFGPDLLFRATDVEGLELHVEICEDFWVPVPPSAQAALAGATVLVNLSGSPITIGRAEDRRLLVRSASARCAAAYVYAAAGQGESTTDLSWDGQTMVYECGDLLGGGRAVPRRGGAHGRRRRPRPDPPGAAAPGQLRRQPSRGRGGRAPGRRARAGAADRRHRAAAQGGPVPVRARRRRAARPGLLRGLQHPGVRPGAADRGDRRSQGGHRRQRWPRLDARPHRGRQGDGPARPPAQRHPRVHHAGLRHRRDHQGLRHPAQQGPRRDVRGDRHPPGRRADARATSATRTPRARRSTTSPSRTSRPACATTTCSGSPTTAAASCVGTGDLSELALGWCTYGVGDQMSHYTSTPASRRRSCSTSSAGWSSHGEFDEDINAGARRDPRAGDHPRADPGRGGQEAAGHRGHGRALQPAGLHPLPRRTTRHRPSKIAFLAWHAWRDAEAGEWPPGFPEDAPGGVRPADGPALAGGVRASGSSPTSSSARRCPTGPRSVPAGR